MDTSVNLIIFMQCYNIEKGEGMTMYVSLNICVF